MNGSVLTKLEIDVMQVNEISDAVELAFKYKLPAIVVHPGLSSDAIIAKTRAKGQFKIITPIDWPKGDTFGLNKLRGLTVDSFETDGFEFLLTPNRTDLETRSEAMALTDFVRNKLSRTAEVRFVLGTSTRDSGNVASMCKGLFGLQTPSYVRTDTQVKLQISKANPEEHNKQIQGIRDIIGSPIKVSGNINNIKCVASCERAARFGVSLGQAKVIIKEFITQPNELQELLGPND